MMARLNLSNIATRRGCAKPGCKATLVYRHHRGGEHTFVRHLRHLRHVAQHRVWFSRLYIRYHAFLSEDIVDICGDHHEEIHVLIDDKDVDWMWDNNCIKAFWRFTPTEAEALMTARRGWTDAWLKERTPGTKTRRYTQYP